ncbi:DUF5719 family protein [Microbacterium sp. LMI1-1-1.1]|uniref:DUF5719 family protein n=1 Tax=Microbacterium sp. LMI1-1-1.1 TaxID=3135223 RepID=UPI00346687B1
MSTDRRLVRLATTSARVIAGTAVATAAVVGTVVAIAAPWPVVASDPVSVEALPTPSDTVLACSGPILALGRTIEQAGALSVAAAPDVVSGGAAQVEAFTLSGDAGADTPAFRAAPQDGARAPLAAAGSAASAAEDLAGFVASACRPPLAESWLVAGATTTGANDLVVLGNPGDVPATVQLSVYGAQGVSTPPGGADVIVPARGQRIVPLAGLLLGEESPAVRVVATGAPVQASLQSTLTRTLLAGGVDQAAPAAQADTRVVVPGVEILTSGEGEVGSFVRLLSPGGDATATVTVTDAAGQTAGDPRQVPLAGGIPTALDLSGIAPGTYTVDVRADAPVVGGVWSTTGFGEGADFAWYAAAPVFDAESVVAVAPGAGARLALVADGGQATTATLTPSDGGSPVQIDVPGDGGVVVDAGAGVYTLSPQAPVRAAVSYTADRALAGYPLWPAEAATAAVTVYP